MCHIILVLPIISLPMFLLLPLPVASVIYLLILAFSAWVFHRLMESLHQPACTGREGMLHACGEVISSGHGHLLVRLAGEIWQARTDERLLPGDPVEVTDVKGLQLSIKRRIGPVANPRGTR